MSTVCTACGRPVAPSATFCVGCGKPTTHACPQCAATVKASATWCPICGAKLTDAVAPQASAPVPTPSYGAPGAWPTQAPGRVRSSRRRPVLIAGVAVAVVTVLVATTVFGDRLPWNTPSLPVAAMPMDAPTVIDVPTEVISTTTVHASGQTIAAGGVKVDIPEGAVSADTSVVIQRLDVPFHMEVNAAADSEATEVRPISPTYDFGPAGTQFGQPVDVTLPFDASYVADVKDPSQIAIAYYTGTHWAVAGGKADLAAHTVTVRLQAFDGMSLMTIAAVIAVGIAVNRAITWWGGSDAITLNKAREYVTPTDATVQAAAATATAGGVKLSDNAKLAAYLEKLDPSQPVAVTLMAGADGAEQTAQWTKNGTGWRKPDVYIKSHMVGDCTDTTNGLVSVFRSLGYQAKGVFGYDVDNEPHAWGEVIIGGKPYLIDEVGGIRPLAKGIEIVKLTRPDDTDPRNYMWDETGQARYKAQWWSPVAMIVQAATPGDGQVGKPFAFKATVKGLGVTLKEIEFLWDFGDESAKDHSDHSPMGNDPKFADPYVDSNQHTYAVTGSYTATVTLWDRTSGRPVLLDRSQVTVTIGRKAASPSPSASASAVASTPALSSAGYWQFVEAKSYPNAEPIRPGAEWTMTADAGHLHFVDTSPNQGPDTVDQGCTWTAAKKLEPGKIVEATVACTDSSQKNSDGNWFGVGPGMTVYIEPPTIPSDGGETWCLELSPVDYQKSGTAKASCSVPAGPLASDPWNGRIALQFNFGGVGYTQWIYKWVPGA